MAPREALDCADRLLRDLLSTDVPFGGKVIVLGGVFRHASTGRAFDVTRI